MNRQIKIASLFLSVVLTFMFMVSCMDSSADEETNAGASVSGTEAESDAATETSAADSTDLDDFSSIVFDENITVEIVTENITSETKTIVYSVENNTSDIIGDVNTPDTMILYKAENGKYERVSVLGGEISVTDDAFEFEAGETYKVNFPVLQWYGELESGGEYALVVYFGANRYGVAEFTVE